MFWKKDEKLETLKDLVGSRAAYIETVKMLGLEGEEKDIFLRASIEVKKNKPNKEIIDKAYAVLIAKSYQGADGTTNEEETDIVEISKENVQDSIIVDMLKEHIGTSQLFMEFINKYSPSQEERAILSGAHQDLKKEPYDMHRVQAANEIISKYTEQKTSSASEHYELKKETPANQNKSSIRKCQQCGAAVEPNAKFCTECGSAILDKKTTSSQKSSPKPKYSNGTLKKATKYVVILALLIGGASFVYHNFSSHNNTEIVKQDKKNIPQKARLSLDSNTQLNRYGKSIEQNKLMKSTKLNNKNEQIADSFITKYKGYNIEYKFSPNIYVEKDEPSLYFNNAIGLYQFFQKCRVYEHIPTFNGKKKVDSTINTYYFANAAIDFDYVKKYKKIKYKINCIYGIKGTSISGSGNLPDRYSEHEIYNIVEKKCIFYPKNICRTSPTISLENFYKEKDKFYEIMK